jgi:hypothetical protein
LGCGHRSKSIYRRDAENCRSLAALGITKLERI